MHLLLQYDLVDDYVEKRAPLRAEHIGLAKNAYDSGDLILAGALSDPIDNAIFVFRDNDPEAPARFAQNDPYVRNGLVKAWRVRKWNTVLGDGAQPPKL